MKLIRFYISCLFPTAKKWWQDRHADNAAALAFYSLISLVPLLVISVYIASLVVDEQTVKQVLITETDRVAGSSISKYIAKMLDTDIKFAGSKFSPILGVLLILFSSTKMISELRRALTKVFGTNEIKKKLYSGIISRGVSFMLIILLGVLIITSVAVDTLVKILMDSAPKESLWITLFSYLSPLSTFLGISFLATSTMRWLPEKRPKLKPALIGGLLCASLLMLLKIAMTLTIQYSDVGGHFGNAFALVLVLFWVYFAMQVFLFSAEYVAKIGNRFN